MSLTFSIRDYTAKMRSRDVFKCWPFPAGDATAEEVRSWLPPMTVPNFRWWSDELAELRSNRAAAGEQENRRPVDEEAAASGERAKSEKLTSLEEEELENPPVEEVVSRNDDGERESEKLEGDEEEEEEKLEMVCPVCRDFNAATLTAVNAHIDGCLREERRRQMRMSKSKSKARKKKRSIAEIFDVEKEEEEEKQLEQEQEEDTQERQRSEIETEMKFWPFGEDVSVTVAKFRWLSRRLEALRSNGTKGGRELATSEGGKSNSVSEDSSSPEEEEKSEMVCPVCRVFKVATVTAANAHIDGCLAQAMREERWQMRKKLCSNLKPKPPKKRSVAEILTVAPQIEAGNSDVAVETREEVEEEEEDDDDEDKRERVVIKRKKNTNKNAKKMMKTVMKKKSKVKKLVGVVPLKNKSKSMKKKKTTKKKKRKNNKNLFNNELAATKEDAYKSKVQSSVNRSRKLKGTGNKTVKLDDIDASFTYEKKLDFKILSEEKKEQVKYCGSVGKQQKAAASPIRGILKTHEHISESTSSGCNVQEGTEESHSDVQVPMSERHVRFSGKDYILGSKDRNSFDETASNLASDALASSLAKEQSSKSDEPSGNLEANRSDDNTAISIDKRKEVCPIVECKQFSNALHQVAVQNLLKPCTNQEKSKHLGEKGESSSNVAFYDKFDKGNTTRPHCSPYAGVSRSLSALQAGQISGMNTQLRESEPFSTRKFIDCLEDPTIQSATVNSNANTRTFPEPSSSYSASYNKGNERSEFQLHSYGDNDNNGKALGGRPLSYMFNADMIDNSYLFHGQGKGSSGDNRMDQNFFGLPLNSHGELIKFSSSGKVGMNQRDTSCTLRGSFSAPMDDISHQNSQQYPSISERHVVQKTLQDRLNPFPHYPARLGVTEIHGRGRADICQQRSDSRYSNHFVQLLDSELNLARSPFIEQNQRDKMPNHKGIGMTSPKESLDPIPPSSSQPTMRLMGKDVPIGGSSKEKQQLVTGDVWVGEESRRRHYAEDAALTNSSLGRCSKQDRASGSQVQTSTEHVLQSVKIQSSPSLQSTFLMKGPGSQFLQSDHVYQKGNPGIRKNASSNLQWQFISGTKPQALSFQSQLLPTPQPTSLSQVVLNDRNKHHHATSSAFGFPFLHQGVEEQAKTPVVQRSNTSLPPWLLGSTHERLPGTSASKSFPQDKRGNNFATPSVNHSAEFQYPPNPCPASIVQPPPHPFIPLAKPPSAINNGYRNITQVTDRMKLNDVTTRDHHPCTNTRKRPASNFIGLTKPNKLQNIEMQENLSRMTGSALESSSVELQPNAEAVELDPRVDGARSRRQNGAQNLNPTSYLGFDSYNPDGTAISGPGAKCVLRPSQNMNQDNTRTIHSAIPINATTDCGRDLELQRRLTKMYRF